VVATLYEGEPIVEQRLAPKGAGAGLAAIIPVGMRAVALRVNEIVGVAGFVVPGMRVDVLVSGNPPGVQTAGTVTRTVLQNIQILSAGQKFEKDAEGKPQTVSVVNVLVTPEQAETLSLASNETRIQLVLRNPLDTQETKTPGTATANLFSGVPFRPVMAEAPAPRVRRPMAPPKPLAPEPVKTAERITIPITVEVMHGSKRTETKFELKSEEKN
jgi:pilus assembly protein CpaB